MPRDFTREYRLDQLHGDAAAIENYGERLRSLITDLRFDARMAEDTATGEAMETLANDLRDAAHGPFSAMIAAHEAACDEEGVEPFYTADPDVRAALGLEPAPMLTRAQLDAAMAEIERRLGVAS